jgi:hypothetical protein
MIHRIVKGAVPAPVLPGHSDSPAGSRTEPSDHMRYEFNLVSDRFATGLPVKRHEIRSGGMPVVAAILGVMVQMGAVPDDDVLAI